MRRPKRYERVDPIHTASELRWLDRECDRLLKTAGLDKPSMASKTKRPKRHPQGQAMWVSQDLETHALRLGDPEMGMFTPESAAQMVGRVLADAARRGRRLTVVYEPGK